MKNINYITVLLFNITILLLIIIMFNMTKKDINEIKEEYNVIKKSSVEYNNLKHSFFLKSEVETKINKMIKRLNLKNTSITTNSEKLTLKLTDSSLYKQEKLLNNILNGRFIILNLKMKKDSVIIEIGLK